MSDFPKFTVESWQERRARERRLHGGYKGPRGLVIDSEYATGNIADLRRDIRNLVQGAVEMYRFAGEEYKFPKTVVSDVTKGVIAKLGRYKNIPGKRFYSWVSVVIRNELIDCQRHIRREVNRRDSRQDRFYKSMDAWVKQRANGHPARLRSALHDVNLPGHDIYRLRTYGYTLHQIAVRLKISDAATRQRWSRFLKICQRNVVPLTKTIPSQMSKMR